MAQSCRKWVLSVKPYFSKFDISSEFDQSIGQLFQPVGNKAMAYFISVKEWKDTELIRIV